MHSTRKGKTTKQQTKTNAQIEIENLKQQILEITDEKNRLLSENKLLQAQVSETKNYIPKEELDDVLVQWENSKKELLSFQEKYSSLLEENTQLKQLVKEQEFALENVEIHETQINDGNSDSNSAIQSENISLRAKNKALKKRLDNTIAENAQLQNEIREQRENYQKDLLNLSSQLSHPSEDVDDIKRDLEDERAKNKSLIVELARLQNSLSEKDSYFIQHLEGENSKFSTQQQYFKLFNDTRKEYADYKSETTEKLTAIELIIDTVSKMLCCENERIIPCMQKLIYKVKEYDRIVVQLAKEELKSTDYMIQIKKLQDQLELFRNQNPGQVSQYSKQFVDIAKMLKEKANSFEERILLKMGELHQKSIDTSIQTNNVHDSLLFSPILNKTAKSPSPRRGRKSSAKSASSSSTPKRNKAVRRSPLSTRSNTLLSESKISDSPSIHRSTPHLPTSLLNPHDFD